MYLFVAILALVALATANTETYLMRIPYHYDIPAFSNPPYFFERSHVASHFNESLAVIEDFPILTKDNFWRAVVDRTVQLPYNTAEPRQNRLLVRLNNYYNTTLQSNDLVSIKVCWPATLPYNFRISHGYYRLLEVQDTLEGPDSFDIYAVVDYEADFATFDAAKYSSTEDTVSFDLHISKLPLSCLPIPLELYDYILYAVGLVIVLVPLVPRLVDYFL